MNRDIASYARQRVEISGQRINRARIDLTAEPESTLTDLDLEQGRCFAGHFVTVSLMSEVFTASTTAATSSSMGRPRES